MEKNQFIHDLKKGQNNAFKRLVDEYQAKVINISNGYLHDRDEAENIAQDVFLEVYQSIHKFRGDSELSTWIYRIAVNKSLNQKKRLNRFKLFSGFNSGNEEEKEIQIQEPEEPSPNAQTTLENQEQTMIIHKAIDKLPENQRTAFILRKYEELSYKEIAEIMQTSVSSVESLLFRAKTSFQKFLFNVLKENGL